MEDLGPVQPLCGSLPLPKGNIFPTPLLVSHASWRPSQSHPSTLGLLATMLTKPSSMLHRQTPWVRAHRCGSTLGLQRKQELLLISSNLSPQFNYFNNWHLYHHLHLPSQPTLSSYILGATLKVQTQPLCLSCTNNTEREREEHPLAFSGAQVVMEVFSRKPGQRGNESEDP